MGSRSLLAEAAAVFLAINGGLCAAAAVLALGGAFSRHLDILSHFALIYLAAAAAGMFLALFLRNWGRRVTLALGAVTLAASLVLVAPELAREAGPTAPASAPGQIRIVQFNALRGNPDLPRALDWIIAQDPDIVTVQEAGPRLRDALVKRTGWAVAGSQGSLMIFSRAPRISMNRPSTGWPLHWVNATYPSASGPFEVVTIHHDWPTSPRHARQRELLTDLVRRLPRERMILTGDFNSASWSAALRRTDAELGLVRRDRAMPTFPADRRGFRWPVPVLPIDHIYAGPGWATVRIERGPRLGSDHYPVVITLAPRAPR